LAVTALFQQWAFVGEKLAKGGVDLLGDLKLFF
jgi:hypothetical protein